MAEVENFEHEIGEALTGLMRSIDAEYEAMPEAELEKRWHFRYKTERSLAWNMYEFHDLLSLYAGSCRRWEEIHNGHSLVVERVRDKYILPKIREFEALVRERLSNEEGREDG